MKRLHTAVLFLSAIFLSFAPGTALARYDAVGNDISGDPGAPAGEGDLCGTCLAPSGDTGVDFQGNDLIVFAPLTNGGDGKIRRFQSCGEVEVITLNPQPSVGFDVGYDSARNLYVVSDASPARILTYATDGTQVGSFVAIGNPVGVSYDANRDVYWVCDWTLNRIYPLDAATGVVGPIFQAPVGTRIAGTGYDAANDAIVYNARDQATGHWISAVDGSLIASYAVPLGGKNNGQGCGVDPSTTNVWLSHQEQPLVYCIFGLGPISTEQGSWGRIKANYR